MFNFLSSELSSASSPLKAKDQKSTQCNQRQAFPLLLLIAQSKLGFEDYHFGQFWTINARYISTPICTNTHISKKQLTSLVEIKNYILL